MIEVTTKGATTFSELLMYPDQINIPNANPIPGGKMNEDPDPV